MAAFIRDLLTPATLTKVVSQTGGDDELLLNRFGFQPGGANELDMGHGRMGTFNVYNNTRVPAKGRAPGTAAARSALQNMGTVPFTYPRQHDSIHIPMEMVANLGMIADPARRDSAAMDMIGRQTITLKKKARNWRTALTVGMLRGAAYLNVDGETNYITYTTSTGAIPINVGRMPSGNTAQLNMLGAGSIIDSGWQNPAADIPKHVGQVSSAMQQLTGFPLAEVTMNWTTFQNVIHNDYVIQLAGSSQQPFTVLNREVGMGADGRPLLAYYSSFNWCPGVKWYITDAGLDLGAEGSESFVKHIPDNYASFSCEAMNKDVFGGYVGSEPIAEYDNGPVDTKVGLASWATTVSNPTGYEVFVLDNFLPVNHVPGTLAYAQVANF
jgi:hypothetical protein